MNLNAAIGDALDLDVDVILEVVHQPGSSIVALVLLEGGGVDVRRHAGNYLKGEVDVAVLVQLIGLLKQAASADTKGRQ